MRANGCYLFCYHLFPSLLFLLPPLSMAAAYDQPIMTSVSRDTARIGLAPPRSVREQCTRYSACPHIQLGCAYGHQAWTGYVMYHDLWGFVLFFHYQKRRWQNPDSKQGSHPDPVHLSRIFVAPKGPSNDHPATFRDNQVKRTMANHDEAELEDEWASGAMLWPTKKCFSFS